MDITFEVIREQQGGYVAACYSENIYTDGSTLEELHCNISNAIDDKFTGRAKPNPSSIQLMMYQE